MSDQDRASVTERPVRVLVVDDDETFRFVMERRLRGSGHHMECVGSGEAALERLATTVFDVILLDLRMPGLSGVDTLRRIRDTEIATEVVMLTGHPDYDDFASRLWADIGHAFALSHDMGKRRAESVWEVKSEPCWIIGRGPHSESPGQPG